LGRAKTTRWKLPSRRRELDVDLAAYEVARRVEPVVKDGEHLVIVREHLGHEVTDLFLFASRASLVIRIVARPC